MNALRAVIVGCALCADAASAGEAAFTIVGADGQPAREAVVFLSNGAAMRTSSPVTVEVDQVDREFVPRITVVQTGTNIFFPNSDNIRHQVYSFSAARTFTLKLYSGRPSTPVTFENAGVVVLGCNIHDHMIAWVLSVETPWFATIGDAGKAVIANAPAGQYEAFVWTPALTAPVAAGRIEIEASGRAESRITLPPATNATPGAG